MSKKYNSLAKASLLLPLVGSGCAVESAKEAVRPNIVLIMADDLGYADISCFGGTVASTPNLDQMAKDGIKLTDFHSNGAVSSPTRAALMTGNYQQRSGVTGVITAANHRDVGLAIDEVTIADRLSSYGYTCGIFGKWHLGYPASFNPLYQGFDEFKGFVAGNIDYHSYIDQSGYYDWWDGKELDREAEGYITDLITQGSVEFIKKNDPSKTGDPFFLYVPYPAPHYPYQAADDGPVREEGNLQYIRKVDKNDTQRLYRDIIEHTDKGIGLIMETLEELGLTDDTMIIFCSDNGPNGSGNTGGYRGAKGSVYEGGHRVPGIIKYPAAIKPNQVSDVPMLGMDFFPTFVEASGHDISRDITDGITMLDHLIKGYEPPKRNLFWAHGESVAMRGKDSWKLIITRGEDGSVKYQLFNMAVDPFEKDDLSSEEPSRVESMRKTIEAWERDVYSGRESII